MPLPRNQQQLRSFLGLIRYYGKFLPDLATILRPLNKLLQKTVRWNWTANCEEAFARAKEMLMSAKVLAHLVYGVKKLNQFLYGRQFTLFTHRDPGPKEGSSTPCGGPSITLGTPPVGLRFPDNIQAHQGPC